MSRTSTVVRWSVRCLLLAALAGALPFVADAKKPPASGLSVSADVVRIDAAKGFYRCTAEVTDLATGKVLIAPDIVFTAEGGGKTSTRREPEGYGPSSEVVFEVAVTKAGDGASFRVSYSLEGVPVSIQKGSLTFR